MAEITLNKDNPTFVAGWYGACPDCSEYQLSSLPSGKLFAALQVDAQGSSRSSFNPALPPFIPQTFKTLECGHSYELTFNPDADETTIDIPGFEWNKVGGPNKGSISASCDGSVETPTDPIKLNKDNPTFVAGWFGACPDCSEYQLSSLPTGKLFAALQVDAQGSSRSSFNPALPPFIPQTFKTLECGHSYELTFNADADESEITIPGFIWNKVGGPNKGSVTDSCAPVTALEKLWISFTGNDHYSDWYELETDEEEEFTKFKIATPNYGSDLYTWASGKATNLQGILMTASENKPSATSLTDDQKAKTFASDLLNLKCNDVFNNGHELADNQVNLRVQAYNNQNVPAIKKYGSHNNTHNYIGTGKPWEGANMVYRTTTFNSIVTDDSGKNSIDIDYLYFIKEADESSKIKFSTATPANSTCSGVF